MAFRGPENNRFDRPNSEPPRERDEYDSSSRYDSGSTSYKSESSSSGSNYSLKSLREFMASKRIFAKIQFVDSERTVMFLKIYIESIGENILVYFPSKYVVPCEEDSIPAIDLVPYDITEEDMVSLAGSEESDEKESYGELNIDDLKDKDSFGSTSYRPISIADNREHVIRKALIGYHTQLDKFRQTTTHLKYKFAILTNQVLSVITRHNETESYLVKSNRPLLTDIIDSKTDSIIPIKHELYIIIDLPSFFEKMDQITGDVIKIYRNWYSMLQTAHTKQTALAEHRFKNYQGLIARLIGEYNKNSKYLDMIANLTASLEKSVAQEDETMKRLELIQSGQADPALGKDTQRSFRLTKTEEDLIKIREVKSKTATLLQELKIRYNAFLISYDSTISTICKNLRQMETAIAELGLKLAPEPKRK